MTPNEILWKALNEAVVPVAERALRELTSTEETVPKEHPRSASVASEKPADFEKRILTPDAQGLSADFMATVHEAVSAAKARTVSPATVAVALSSEQDEIFRSARRHAAWYFALNLSVSIATSLLFLGGAAGAILTTVATGASIWTAVFGGTSLVGVFGLLITRPIHMTYSALLATTRLDYLQLMSRQRMHDCASLATLPMRIKCRTQVWEEMRKELASLEDLKGQKDSNDSATDPPTPQAS